MLDFLLSHHLNLNVGCRNILQESLRVRMQRPANVGAPLRISGPHAIRHRKWMPGPVRLDHRELPLLDLREVGIGCESSHMCNDCIESHFYFCEMNLVGVAGTAEPVEYHGDVTRVPRRFLTQASAHARPLAKDERRDGAGGDDQYDANGDGESFHLISPTNSVLSLVRQSV